MAPLAFAPPSSAPPTPGPLVALRVVRPGPGSGDARQFGRGEGLIDSFGRRVRELRLSVTDRCNFRCVYCLDPGVRFAPAEDVLTTSELARVARVCATLGITKVRLTGGEPTLHPELDRIIAGVADAGITDIAATTNGSRLSDENLSRWKAAGLRRLTISLDSVDPERFGRVTRSASSPGEVIAGVRRAIAHGLTPVKLNSVLIRGINDDQVVPLIRLARGLGVEVRFIEFMPLDSGHRWDASSVVPAAEVIERVREVYSLTERPRSHASETSEGFDFADGAPGGVGVIAPVTRPFCGECSRLRITADGKVRPCLFSREEFDLVPMLRGVSDDGSISGFIADAVWTKQAGHGINLSGFVQPERAMSAIGG